MTSRAFLRPALITAGALLLTGTLAACSTGAPATEGGGSATDAATATSAEDFGGIDGLVAAAQEEGQLNVVALPEDWANYGEIIAGFEEKYEITVNSAYPNASSAEEIQAAENLKGQDTAPDVFDLGSAVALANTDKFAAYQVENWDDIPAENKEASGLWVNNYSGIMSLGYDADKFAEPEGALRIYLATTISGAVALNGDPTQAGAAFAAVGLALRAERRRRLTTSDLALTSCRNCTTPATSSRSTRRPRRSPPARPRSYSTGPSTTSLTRPTSPPGKPRRSTGPVYVSFYNEAINKDAPNPAAARLWQEWIFSDEAQKLYLEGNAMPVRLAALHDAGTADEKLVAQAAFGQTRLDWVTPDPRSD